VAEVVDGGRRTSERLVNLTIALLTARTYLSRDRLREMVEGYRGLNDDNFMRQFERDKDTLRNLGVPIEVGTDDRYFDDEVGYRIRRDDFELPPVTFDSDEVAVLVCATQVWQQAATAETTAAALAKLWASGIEPDMNRMVALQPHISAREPVWQPIWAAVQARQKVCFDYHDVRRVVQPWALAWRGGAWYLAGFDETRGDKRVFKLARLRGGVQTVGAPEAYEMPDMPVDELLAGLKAPAPDAEAVVDIRVGRAPWLTRRALSVGDAAHGWQRWRVPYAVGPDAVGDLAMAGADARVVEPPELAAAVSAHHAALLQRLGVTS